MWCMFFPHISIDIVNFQSFQKILFVAATLLALPLLILHCGTKCYSTDLVIFQKLLRTLKSNMYQK